MDSVTIIRRRDYSEVFTDQVHVPESLRGGLVWIQQHCPLDEPTRVVIAELATAWNVPEAVVVLGLQTLARTGFFSMQ